VNAYSIPEYKSGDRGPTADGSESFEAHRAGSSRSHYTRSPRAAVDGFDACLFCLGVSALGMTEEQYTRVTYDLTMSIAQTVLRTSPI